MAYSIIYYSHDVQEDIMNLPVTLQARYIGLTDRMIEHGPNLGLPHTDAFGSGLFELRLKGAEGIARVFFCTMVGQEIVMLHSFIKKTQKTPDKELKLTKQRMKELKKMTTRKTKTLTHKQMVSKMLKNSAVKAEVDKLNREEFAILDEILAARKAAGLSQAQIAKRMGTQAPAIARLESALATGKHSPSLSTLRKYAAALGKKVELHLV